MTAGTVPGLEGLAMILETNDDLLVLVTLMGNVRPDLQYYQQWHVLSNLRR